MTHLYRAAAAASFAALFWGVMVAGAKAADLAKPGSPAMGEAAAAAAAPANHFQGPYVGVGIGAGTGQLKDGTGASIAAEGVTVSGIVGYNAVLSGGIVLGLEADGTLTGVRGSAGPDGAELKTGSRWQASLRGRAGYLLSDRMMPYITAGGAWSKNTFELTLTGEELSKLMTGIVFGGGLEYALTNNAHLRLEYLRTQWGGFDLDTTGGTAPDLHRVDQTVRAGVTFQLN